MSFLSKLPKIRRITGFDFSGALQPTLDFKRASTGISFQKSAFRTIASDIPRIDEGSFGTPYKGLLVESSRTNRMSNSHLNTAVTVAAHAVNVTRGVADPYGGSGAVRLGVNNANTAYAEVGAGIELAGVNFAAGTKMECSIFFRPVNNQPFTLHSNVMIGNGTSYAYASSVAVTQNSDGVGDGGYLTKKLSNGWWKVDVSPIVATAAANASFRLHFFRREGQTGVDLFDVYLPTLGTGVRGTTVPAGAGATTRAADVATQALNTTGKSLLVQATFMPVAASTDVLHISDGVTSFSINYSANGIFAKVNSTVINESKFTVAPVFPNVVDLLALYDRDARKITMSIGTVTVTVSVPAAAARLGNNLTLRLGSNTDQYSSVFKKLDIYDTDFDETNFARLKSLLGLSRQRV